MRRGRIFIYLALIIVVVIVGAVIYLKTKGGAENQTAALTQTAVVKQFVQVISAAQPIAPGTMITEAMLTSYQMPEANLVQGLFTDSRDVVNMYAKVSIPQGAPITATELTSTAGNINLPGSTWAAYIPQGLTAISIPVTRLSSAAFSIRDGDYVNVIVSMILLDIDPATQSALPEMIAGIKIDAGALTITPSDLANGHFQSDEVTNALTYLYPSESQRPRMVTQMIMQNVQVMHVGSFPLPGEANSEELNPQGGAAAADAATPQPAGQGQPQTTTGVVKPDIVTLMVTPQDAVTLTYMIYSNVQINLTLRNPNDQEAGVQPDAAMLEYLLTQYNIPVPAKIPYSLNPRLDTLQQPTLANDKVTP
jgi:Flp pilus assembly protein CpaB